MPKRLSEGDPEIRAAKRLSFTPKDQEDMGPKPLPFWAQVGYAQESRPSSPTMEVSLPASSIHVESPPNNSWSHPTSPYDGQHVTDLIFDLPPPRSGLQRNKSRKRLAAMSAEQDSLDTVLSEVSFFERQLEPPRIDPDLDRCFLDALGDKPKLSQEPLERCDECRERVASPFLCSAVSIPCSSINKESTPGSPDGVMEQSASVYGRTRARVQLAAMQTEISQAIEAHIAQKLESAELAFAIGMAKQRQQKWTALFGPHAGSTHVH